MVTIIQGLAEEQCDNRLVLVLEGGYSLSALAASVNATFEVLLKYGEIEDPVEPSPLDLSRPHIEPLVRRIQEIHSLD